ncbi:MAG: phosphatase PAP2 family protein, partial [Methylococcales bacterium]|nr:phosphatase PAP2 family protein [Methylococcales bacterium]
RLGVHISYALVVTNLTNNYLKHMIRGPRPFWLDESVGLSNELSYGVPSGHVQSATLFYFFLASWIKRSWAWALALLMVGLMMLSRVYLGMHFVHDVAVGLILGLLTLLLYFLYLKYGSKNFESRLFGQRLLAVVVVPLIPTLLYILTMFYLGSPDTTVKWGALISSAEIHSWESSVTTIAIILALGVGFTLEKSRVVFLVDGPIWVRALRYLLGMVVTIALWKGLSVVFAAIAPAETLWLALPLRFIRYLMVGLWISYWAPMVFVKLRLVHRLSEPEIPFTIHGVQTPEKRDGS